MLIGYARISTIDQNLDLQLDALKKAGCEKIYRDTGISGAKAKRPGLDRAIKRLKADDVLMVWRLDRLGRSMRHLIELTSMFDARGIGFCSLADAIDTSTAGGKLYFHLMGAFAEFERNLISERTKAGMAAAKARGIKMGRPKKHCASQDNQVADFESDVLNEAARALGADNKIVRDRHETVQ
ncbi:recombinase family protein [Hyphococcus lacteus]|uniref:Recombinase family protein n=1 Tax=Hyphococcus lacteus TaxID=3143536 RepID=A0ABV3Z3Q0_9PROT